jgi:hypothetical protein
MEHPDEAGNRGWHLNRIFTTGRARTASSFVITEVSKHTPRRSVPMNQAKRILAAVVVGSVTAISTVGTSLAFDPGMADGTPPAVPQGPDLVACENQGGALNPADAGVFQGIEVGGDVHCEQVPD